MSLPPDRLHTGIFRMLPAKYWRGKEPTEADIQVYLDRSKLMAKRHQDWLRTYFRHRVDCRAEGFVFEDLECNQGPYEYCKRGIGAWMADNPEIMDGFKPNHYGLWSNIVFPGFCGQNLIGQPNFLISDACREKTCHHEEGHALGLHHANTIDPQGQVIQYNDIFSVMGVGDSLGLNAHNYFQLRLLDADEYLDIDSVDESVQVCLAPLETEREWLREGELRMVMYANQYFISIRKARGFKYKIPQGEERRLFIYVTGVDGRSNVMIPEIWPGQGKTLLDGCVIEYMEYKDECARINIIPPGKIIPEDIPMPTGFPEPDPEAQLLPEYTGLYYDPDYYGQGFDIQIKDGRCLLYWYTYSEELVPFKADQPKYFPTRFYLGIASPINGVAEFPILTTAGGSFADPTTRNVATQGKGRLEFHDSGNATFLWDMPEFGRGSTRLVPIAKSVHPMSGAYYDVGREGEGFTIQFFKEGRHLIAYWYTYGDPRRALMGGNVPDTTQRWFMCDGVKISDDEYDALIYEMRGGKWMRFDDSEPVRVGNCTLEILGDDDLQMVYHIDAGAGVAGNGTLELTRLF